MSALTKTLDTESVCTLKFVGPTKHAKAARETMEGLGFSEREESVPWREAFPDLTDEMIPATVLRGSRYKEGITQIELARLTKIPQRHISEMENGKRTIGKERAKKFAAALNVNYKIFL